MDSVAIIILTKNNFEVIEKCLDSFKEKNTYTNIKFYIGDTGSNKESLSKLENYLNSFKYKKELLKFNYYNFAKNHNWIIKNRVKEDFILFCNDDIELKNDALTLMIKEWEPGIGTVGCKLLFPNNTIQHGGHIHFIHNNNIEVSHKHLFEANKKLNTEYNVGNTFAFCLVNKKIFLSIKGLNTLYKKCFEDVEFCIDCTNRNLKHKFVGLAECFHLESVSRKKAGSIIDIEDVKKIKQKLNDLYKNYGTAEKIS